MLTPICCRQKALMQSVRYTHLQHSKDSAMLHTCSYAYMLAEEFEEHLHFCNLLPNFSSCSCCVQLDIVVCMQENQQFSLAANVQQVDRLRTAHAHMHCLKPLLEPQHNIAVTSSSCICEDHSHDQKQPLFNHAQEGSSSKWSICAPWVPCTAITLWITTSVFMM